MAVTTSATLPIESVPLSPRAKEIFEKSFKPRFTAMQADLVQTPLTILVWGPGPGNPELYAKRMQIRDALRQREHVALFSEDLIDLKPADYSEKIFEYQQAKAADFIVVLQVSFGSIAEVHDFADDREIIAKMLIFVPEQATDGYSYKGALTDIKALYKNVETFQSTADLVSCRLKTMVLEYVSHLQASKWLIQQKAKSWG